MSEIKINIDQTQDISFLIDATNDVLNATESDFAAMKQKKWYTRLWETITFSKDNQIRTANGVANLAKLQEVLVRVLVNLSSNNAVISEVVKNNSRLITQLSCIDRQLLREINKIKYGSSSFIEFPTLDIERKMQLAYFLVKADVGAKKTELSQKYIGAVLIVAGLSAIDDNWDVSVIDTWSRQEQELLYRMIITNRYLLEIDYHAESEVIDNLSISSKRKAEIESIINETANNTSPDFFVSFFDKTVENMLQNEDDILFVVEDEDTYAEPNEEDSIDTYDPEERIKEEEASKKIYELCGGAISSIISTKDYALIYFEPKWAPETPRWLSRRTSTTEDIDENGLYAIHKYTGEISFVLPLNKLPSGNRLVDTCYYNNLLFALIESDDVAELYLIDISGKTIKRIFRVANYDCWGKAIMFVDEKYIVIKNSKEGCSYVIAYTSCTAKKYSSKFVPHLSGEWLDYEKMPCTIRNGGMSVLAIDSLEPTKSISWRKEEESSLNSAIIHSGKVFLLRKTGEWGTRVEYGKDEPIGSIYSIISVDINNPNTQSVILSDLRLKRVQRDHSGWVMARFSAGSIYTHEWLYFDVIGEELHCITTDLADSYSEGHFSKKCTGITIGKVERIGKMFFYKKTSGTVGCVHIEDLI